MTPIQVGPEAAAVLAEIHDAASDDPWCAADMAKLLSSLGVWALLAAPADMPAAFVMARVVADEAEILTLATVPGRRRQGLARRLMEAAVSLARGSGAKRLLLEVADDNVAARALYESLDFQSVGRRPGYYARGTGPADAIILCRGL